MGSGTSNLSGTADARLWPIAPQRCWIAVPLVALAYAGAAAVSLALAIPPGYASAVWPPAGIVLAARLALGPRIWPAIAAGAAAANFGVAETTPAVALAIGLGNTTEAALAGALVTRLIGPKRRFESPAAVWRFAAIAFGASLVAATNGVAVHALAGRVPWEEFALHWLTWWLGDATGIVIVAPLLLCWSEAAQAPVPASSARSRLPGRRTRPEAQARGAQSAYAVAQPVPAAPIPDARGCFQAAGRWCMRNSADRAVRPAGGSAAGSAVGCPRYQRSGFCDTRASV